MADRSYDGKAYLNPDGAKPVSFTPNVNRMKTRRWVEAKKISYDGDDWGDDEYGEYDHDDEEEELPPVPSINPALLAGQSNTTSRTTPNAPARPGPNRSMTMDTVGSVERPSPAGRSQTTDVTSGGSATERPVPFVRPADIYKRMREERQRQGSAQGSSPSSESTFLPPINSRPDARQSPKAPEQPEGLPEQSTTFSAVKHKGESRLPDVRRLSTFDTNFLGTDHSFSQSPVQEPQRKDSSFPRNSENPQENLLQHNPSLGFRSAVNQAFDVPETPSTAVDSLERSNSDGTSVLSPIMSSRSPDDVKTPTIAEEPGGPSAPVADADRTPVFKPGHRRDLSLPSSDNSPSRRPEIREGEPVAESTLADVSTVSLLDAVRNSREHLETDSSQFAPTRRPQGTSEHDLPLPLRLNNSPSSDARLSADELPTIVPSLSTETSPQDTESDRLRKEIILSLSRENSPGRDSDPQHPEKSEAVLGSTLAPNDHPIHGTHQTGPPTDSLEHRGPLHGDEFLPEASAKPPSADIYSPVEQSNQATQPKRSRRFSWESSGSDASEPPDPNYLLHQPEVTLQPSQISAEDAIETDTPIRDPEDDALQHEGERSLTEDVHGTEAWHDLSVGHLANAEGGMYSVTPDQDFERARQMQLSSSIDQPLLGFRDILGIKSSQERIRAFDRTRYQFASIETGLGDWIEATILAHPEYSGIVEQSKKFSVANQNQLPSKAKFPKLTSLGNLTSHLEGPGSLRRPSAQLGSQRGKDFLQTAGLLGGKAGGAARELLAKGRSKLRSGGTDKVYQSIFGRRKSLPHPDAFPSSIEDLVVFYGNNPLLRTSIDLATLPDVKFPEGVEVITGIDPTETSQEGVYSQVDVGKRISVASHSHVTFEREEKKGETMIPGLMTPVQPEYLVLSVSAVDASCEQQSLSSTGTTAHPPQENLPQINDSNDLFGSSFDFEQELVSALRLDGTDSLSQGLILPGLLSGANNDNNNRLSLAMLPGHSSPVADDAGIPSESSSVTTMSQDCHTSDVDIAPLFVFHGSEGQGMGLTETEDAEQEQRRVGIDNSQSSSRFDASENTKPVFKSVQEKDHVSPRHSDEVVVKKEDERPRFLLKDDVSRGANDPDGSPVPEDATKAGNIEKHGYIESHHAVGEHGSNDDAPEHVHSQANENPPTIDDSGIQEGLEKGDCHENPRLKDLHPEDNKDLGIDSSGDPEDSQANSPIDLEVADFTVVRPIRDTRVNLLINGRPVDTSHAEVGDDSPSEPNVSNEGHEAKERGSVDESAFSGAEKAGKNSVQDAESHQRAVGGTSNQNGATKKIDATISEGPKSDRKKAEKHNSNVDVERSGSNVSQNTNLSGSGQDPVVESFASSEAEKPQSSSEQSSKNHQNMQSNDSLSHSTGNRSPVEQLKDERFSEDNGVLGSFRVRDSNVTNERRSAKSTTPLRIPQSRFYRAPMQSPVEQNGGPRSSTNQAMSSVLSSAQPNEAAVGPQSQLSRPGPGPVHNSSGVGITMTQTASEGQPGRPSFSKVSPISNPGVATPKQSPRPSMQRSEQPSPLQNSLTGSISSLSESGKRLQSPFLAGGESSAVKDPAPSVSTLSTADPECQKGYDNGQAALAAPAATSMQPPSQSSQTPSVKSRSSFERWKNIKISLPHRLSTPQKGPFHKLNGFFRRSAGRDSEQGKAPMRAGPNSQSSADFSQTPRISMSRPGSSPTSPYWFSPDDKYNPNQHRGEGSPLNSNPVRARPPPAGGYYARSPSISNNQTVPSGDRLGEEQHIPNRTLDAILESNGSSQSPRSHHWVSAESPPQQSTLPSVGQAGQPSPLLYQTTSSGQTRSKQSSSSLATAAAASPTPIIQNGENKERSASISEHRPRGEARAINLPSEPVELPISADDSSEEIVMSSTAYPGQEWKPSGFDNWGQY